MEWMLGGIRRRIALTSELVALPHTIFALPFALMGMLLGAAGWPTIGKLVWIILAMVGARTTAMSFNRIADRRYDAENPRTRGRPLPSGRLGVAWAVGVLISSCAVFLIACWALGPVCLALSPLALAIILGYSLTKRFTWGSHLFLGLSLAIAPAGAWVAVAGPLSLVPVLLSFAVICWTAGFDILYACHDVEFDRSRRLHSIPARFGIRTALKISAALHLLMVVALIGMAILAGLGAPFFAGLTLTAAVLVYEHRIVRADDLSRLDLAFFTLNGWISVSLLLATVLDLAL